MVRCRYAGYRHDVRYANLLRELEQHGDALRDAAVAAGPDTAVPTCPRWTVRRLLGHVGRVYSWALAAIADPAGAEVEPESPPQDWNALLPWYQSQHDRLIMTFGTDPAAPAWLPFARYEQCVFSWARRMAHETAIHRLDAEQATSPRGVAFEAEFAADGIDELLSLLLPSNGDWTTSTVSGTALVAATDTGTAWLIRLSPAQPPRVDDATHAATRPGSDVSVTGTADDIYRAVWRRPSAATVTGDTTVLEPLAAP